VTPRIGGYVLFGDGDKQPIEWVRYRIAFERSGRAPDIDVSMSALPGGEAWFTIGRTSRGNTMVRSEETGLYVGRARLPERTTPSFERVVGHLRLNGELYESEARLDSGGGGIQLELAADPAEASADGLSPVTLTVVVRGPDDEPLSGRLIDFERLAGGGELLPLRPLTDDEGQATARYVTGLTADTAVFEVRDVLSGASATTFVRTSLEASVDVVLLQRAPPRAVGLARAGASLAVAARPVHIALSVSPPVLPADGRSVGDVVATLTDDIGQPVPGAEVRFEAPPGLGRLSPATATTDDRGRAVARFEAGLLAGTADITVTHIASRQTASAQVSLVVGGVARVEISTDPESLPADGISTARITVRVMDLLGRPVEGVPVVLRIEGARGSLRQADMATDAVGEVRGRLRAGLVPGTIRITAQVLSPVPEEFREQHDTWPTDVAAKPRGGVW